jgi:hypothetical protein
VQFLRAGCDTARVLGRSGEACHFLVSVQLLGVKGYRGLTALLREDDGCPPLALGVLTNLITAILSARASSMRCMRPSALPSKRRLGRRAQKPRRRMRQHYLWGDGDSLRKSTISVDRWRRADRGCRKIPVASSNGQSYGVISVALGQCYRGAVEAMDGREHHG